MPGTVGLAVWAPVSEEGWPACAERVQGAASEDNSPGALCLKDTGRLCSREENRAPGRVVFTRPDQRCHNTFGADGNDPTPVKKTHDVDNANHATFLIYMFTTSPCIP